MAQSGVHSAAHRDRRTFLTRPPTAVPRDVFIAYRELKDWSELVRYACAPVTDTAVRDDLLRITLPIVTNFVAI